MTLILETGYGVRTANAYDTAANVLAYLTARNRETENSFSTLTTAVQEAHIIAATQYIDNRYGARFKGIRTYSFDGGCAQAIIDFSAEPTDGDTLTLGTTVYTFVTALSTLTADNEVLLSGTLTDTLDNLVEAISGTANGSGTNYSSNTEANREVSAEVDDDTTSQVNLTARAVGTSGNEITFTNTLSSVPTTIVGFINGKDVGSQPLEFPRTGLVDDSGRTVHSIPKNLKDAVAEYAVRSASSSLFVDPVVDSTGRAVIRKKVGPLETEFADGSSLDLLIRPYPAADRLLTQYLTQVGRIR